MNLAHYLVGQPWVAALGRTLIHFLWQGAAIAVVYAAIRKWFGSSATPNARYILACAALAAMMAAPLVTFSVTGHSEIAEPAARVSNIPVAPDAPGSNTAVRELIPLGGPLAVSGEALQNFLTWIVLLWLAGASLLWVRLLGGWVMAMRMRSVDVWPAPQEWQDIFSALSARVGLSRPVRFLVSARAQVPMVLGWLRPVVLFPIGTLAGLPVEQVEALLVHELAHIRRCDYLINMLQSVCEALLFYHPAVWWISGQIRSERELCCDDVAVSVSGDVLTYATALAELESHRPAQLTAAIAASGGSLEYRIGRLLGESQSGTHMRPGFSILMSTLVLVVVAYGLFGQQSPATRPTFDAFEVATIKPSDPNVQGRFIRMQSAHQLLVKNESLKAMVTAAYKLSFKAVSGGPAWVASDRYDIVAETPGEVRPNLDEQMSMLRSLLADRFKLTFHREQKEMSVYALTVAKGGPKLKETIVSPDASPEGPPPLIFVLYPDRASLPGRYATMTELANVMQFGVLDRPVIDRTGIRGRYDFDLEFTPDETEFNGAAGSGNAESTKPDLFAAIQQQLGLRLEATKGPVDVLVIDHAERPSEN